MRELLLFLNIFLEFIDDLLMLINVYWVVDNKLCKVIFIDSIYRVKFIELYNNFMVFWVIFIGNRFSVFRVNYDGYILKN